MQLERRTVLVTGASGGIGASLVQRFAARGAAIVAVARDAARLRELADRVERQHPGARVETVPLDLTDSSAGEHLQHRVDELGLDVFGLVNNAGVGTNGPFADTPVERVLQQVDLDVRALVELTARFLPPMIAARSGFVVNIGSTSGYQPVPGMAAYGAAKAFVRSFNDALWFEARPAGVRVLGVAPGGVETGFFAAAGAEFLTRGRLTPDQVADFTLAHLDGTGPMTVPGLRNRLGTLGSRFAPQRLLIAAAARIVAPVTPTAASRSAGHAAAPR